MQLIARSKEALHGGVLDYGLGVCYLRSCVAVRDKTSKMCQSQVQEQEVDT